MCSARDMYRLEIKLLSLGFPAFFYHTDSDRIGCHFRPPETQPRQTIILDIPHKILILFRTPHHNSLVGMATITGICSPWIHRSLVSIRSCCRQEKRPNHKGIDQSSTYYLRYDIGIVIKAQYSAVRARFET